MTRGRLASDGGEAGTRRATLPAPPARAAVLAVAAALLAAPAARADDCSIYANVCENACSASAYQAACLGTVTTVDDIFRTRDGGTAQALTFASYLSGVNSTGCAWGQSFPDAGLAYQCHSAAVDDPAVAAAIAGLDYLWVQNFRQYPDGGLVCDCQPGFYDPRDGLLFDLGGEANKVVVFPVTDHGPLPCESFEYSVYLTDDLDAGEVVPLGDPVDPHKWNEAELYEAFLQGWDPNATADGMTTVWQLPCGVTFRYASVLAGNHGNPTSACEYDSSEDEIDAVAGMNQDDTAICPDRDHDGYADIACGGTDCDDSDPAVHPGAPENCSSTKDMDCDGKIPTCPAGTLCVAGQCAQKCGGGEFGGACPPGLTCIGAACLPAGCAAGCDAGTVCNGSACVDPCAGALCPRGEACRGGGCVDPCLGVRCPAGQVCEGGACEPSCACLGCPAGEVCLDAGSCAAADCAGVACPSGETCADGGCVSGCTGVVCPVGQSCAAGSCAPDPCFAVQCPGGGPCVAGSCLPPPDAGVDGGEKPPGAGRRDAGLPDAGVEDAGAPVPPADAGPVAAPEKSGCCGCGEGGAASAIAGLLAAWTLRKRRGATTGRG